MSRAHWIATLCRVFCGIVFIVHGTPKILNLQATSEWFSGIGFPGWVAIPVAILEFFGGILLVVGFLTRILSGLFIIEMIVAALKVHFPYGFEVFHLGDPMARGYEYNVALILLLLVVVLLGAGPVSIDGAIAGRKGAGGGPAPGEPGAV